MTTPARPEVTSFFDPNTLAVQYVVADPGIGQCAIIDPVLDFDHRSGMVSTENADRIRGGSGNLNTWISGFCA